MAAKHLNPGKFRQALFVLSRNMLPWLLSVLVTAILGSLVQSTLSLINVQEMGAYATFDDGVRTIGHDLLAFMPFYAAIVAVTFLLALPAALWMARKWPKYRTLLLAASGAVGLALAFFIANRVTPMPTVISATRDVTGTIAMLTTGILGAWVFALTSSRPDLVKAKGFTLALLAFPLLVLGVAVTTHILMKPDREYDIDDYPAARYRVSVLVDGLEHPWGMALLPGGGYLITERPGRVRLVDRDGALLEEPLDGVPEVLTVGEGGLLDIQLSPDFAEDGYVFLTHSCGTPEANNTCLSRGRLRERSLENVEQLFQAQPLKATRVQFGSRIAFLPDRTLVVSVGDGFDYSEEAQGLRNHLGKLVRLNPDGSVPDDNPFVDRTGVLSEIYSYGHRNPQGLVYNSATGELFESEHGPYGGDEINIITAGTNYGWPLATEGVNYPGNRISPHDRVDGTEPPIQHWTPSIAPSGITIYRGAAFPEFDGDLLVGSLAGQGVYRLRIEDGEVTEEHRLFHELEKRIRQVVVGPEGEIYLLTDHDPGQVLRVDPAGTGDGSD